MNWLTNILETYRKGTEYDKDLGAAIDANRKLYKEQKQFIACINDLEAENLLLYKQIEDLQENGETELDTYLKANTKKIRNIAYQEKRYFEGKPISIYLNELIQRDSYEVLKLKKEIKPSGSNLNRARQIGTKVSRLFTWTDDKQFIKSGDLYVQPNEAIVFKKVDCEDHSFVVASLDSEIGIAYGFMTVNGTKFGHAWNAFVHNNELYYMETTGNSGSIIKASKANNYDCRYIITKENTYRLGAHISFGKIAEAI